MPSSRFLNKFKSSKSVKKESPDEDVPKQTAMPPLVALLEDVDEGSIEFDEKLTLPTGRIGIKFAGLPPVITNIADDSPLLGKVLEGQVINGAVLPGVKTMTNLKSTQLARILKSHAELEGRVLLMKGPSENVEEVEDGEASTADAPQSVATTEPVEEDEEDGRDEAAPDDNDNAAEPMPEEDEPMPEEDEPVPEEDEPMPEEDEVQVIPKPIPSTTETDVDNGIPDSPKKEEDRSTDVEDDDSYAGEEKKTGDSSPAVTRKEHADESVEAKAAEASYQLCGISFCG